MSEAVPKTIAAALVKAQKCVRPVGKSGHNAHAGYNYATMDSLSEEARRAMTDAGLALSVVGASPVTIDGERRLSVTAILCHDSGDTWVLPGYSIPVIITVSKQGNKAPADKAEAAAMTYARGYLALCLLQIAREDENAVDQRDDRDSRPAASSVDVSKMLAAFAAIGPGDVDKCAAYIRKADEVHTQLSEEDYAKVGSAIEAAKARAEQAKPEAKTSKQETQRGAKPLTGPANPADCHDVPSLSQWINSRRDLIKTLPVDERALVRSELTASAKRLGIDHVAMLTAAGL